MDNSGVQNPGIEERASGVTRRRYRTVEEKRRIVQESLKPGASVAVVARRFDVNANQVFTWRRQVRGGVLTGRRVAPGEGRLLPVAVQEVGARTADHSPSVVGETLHTGRIEIEFSGGPRLCIQGCADPDTLSAVIRALSQP
ncbi:MAG: IS66-like element accessory protein TnpA [Steroidobacteraceae bacterium]